MNIIWKVLTYCKLQLSSMTEGTITYVTNSFKIIDGNWWQLMAINAIRTGCISILPVFDKWSIKTCGYLYLQRKNISCIGVCTQALNSHNKSALQLHLLINVDSHFNFLMRKLHLFPWQCKPSDQSIVSWMQVMVHKYGGKIMIHWEEKETTFNKWISKPVNQWWMKRISYWALVDKLVQS